MKGKLLGLLIAVLLVVIVFSVYLYLQGSHTTIDGFLPTVKMVQSEDSIVIEAVIHGPITNSSSTPTFSIINQTSGLLEGTAKVYDSVGGNATRIEDGDVIKLSGISTKPGTKYIVRMFIGDDVIIELD